MADATQNLNLGRLLWTGCALLWLALLVCCAAFFIGIGIGQTVEHFSSTPLQAAHSEGHSDLETEAQPPVSTSLTGVFFSIYYAMTGVHAIHIFAGMGVIAWLLYRSLRGEFGPNYFGPVDYVGLYWHLVDLVWIYLFPLLYLIR